MRILLTTDTVGGVWVFAKELAAGLLQMGHHVALVSVGRAPSAGQQRTSAALLQLHRERFRFEALTTPLEWMQENDHAYTEAEPSLLRIASSFLPDILHTNQFCFGRLPLSIPRLITAHSDVLSWAVACKPTGLEQSAWIDRYVSLVQQGLSSASAVTAPTAWMLSALQAHFKTEAHVQVISNGRTVSTQRPNVSKLQAVSVGRFWDQAKNLSLLASIDSPIPILLAGEQEYETFSAPASIGQVQTLGPLSEQDLLDLFASSSLYIAASIYEPFGLAPLEAALCGCAVLANDIPSLREVWGHASLYFRTAQELTGLLRHLAASPDVLAAACLRSRSRAREFTAARMVKAYESLYRDLLCSQSRALKPELVTHVC